MEPEFIDTEPDSLDWALWMAERERIHPLVSSRRHHSDHWTPPILDLDRVFQIAEDVTVLDADSYWDVW